MATHVDLLTKSPTLIPNAGPRVVQKGPWGGVIYLQISEMNKWRNYAIHVAFTVDQCTRRTHLTIYLCSLIIFFGYVQLCEHTEKV